MRRLDGNESEPTIHRVMVRVAGVAGVAPLGRAVRDVEQMFAVLVEQQMMKKYYTAKKAAVKLGRPVSGAMSKGIGRRSETSDAGTPIPVAGGK